MTYEDDLEEHLLVNLHELLIPLLNVRSLLTAIVLVVGGLGRVVPVVLTPLDYLPKYGLVDVGDGDGVVGNSAIAKILDHVADKD